MLAQLQLKYGIGNLQRYNEAMLLIREAFENEGVRLRHAMITRVGRLYEVWNLWEIEDQGHIARAFAGMIKRADAMSIAESLSDIVEYEDVRFLEALPFSPEQDGS